MGKTIKRTILMPLGTILVLFLVAIVVGNAKADSINHNATEWAWGGSSDSTGIETGLGAISFNDTNEVSGTSVYGVNIPTTGGNITGYAWSSNLGYINFNPSVASAPEAPFQSATVDASGNITGWARFEEIAAQAAVGNSGGWQGWIKMAGSASDGSTYGVSVVSGSLSGYGWSNELGYIDFSGVKLPVPPSINSFSATPAATNIEDNPNFLTTANNVTLTWDADDANSCEITSTSSLSLSGLPASGNQTVSQTSGFVNYTLTCIGDVTPNDSETRSVYTYCNNTACGATDLCESTENQGATSASQCTKECSSDAACVPVSTGEWREVTP